MSLAVIGGQRGWRRRRRQQQQPAVLKRWLSLCRAPLSGNISDQRRAARRGPERCPPTWLVKLHQQQEEFRVDKKFFLNDALISFVKTAPAGGRAQTVAFIQVFWGRRRLVEFGRRVRNTFTPQCALARSGRGCVYLKRVCYSTGGEA